MKKSPTTCACIVCRGMAYFIRSINNHQLYHCEKCGLEFCNPMPSSHELRAFYRSYSDIRAREDVVKLNAKKNINFLSRYHHFNKNMRLLDYGCGQNLFVKTCHLQGITESYGYDPYITTTAPDYTLSWNHCRNRNWDFITLWGVLEHLSNPITTMTKLSSLLCNGALIVLTTVCTHTNIPYQHKPPEHTLYYTQKSLELLAKTAKLSLIGFQPYTMWQDSDVYLSILLRRAPQNIRTKITHTLNKYIKVPTNEVMAIFKKL